MNLFINYQMLVAQKVQDGCCSKQWRLTREKAQSLPQGAFGLIGRELVEQVENHD